MASKMDAPTLKRALSDGREIALIDVREHGQFGEGHLFFAVPLAYSRFELGLPTLVPNTSVRLVLCDAGDGVAERAARRAEALGYDNVAVLEGGIAAWQGAGYTLYAGVNVPSKTFGELVEAARHTPRLSPGQVAAMREAKENVVIVDGRPFAEYSKMNIPGGICCPNGDLPLRIGAIAPDPNTTIIVNCAGRTRSIIGAQMLIDFGVPNPVYALENGTQGWFLGGLPLEHGANRRAAAAASEKELAQLGARARAQAQKHGVEFVGTEAARAWLGERGRTTYCLDVRSPEEFAAAAVPGFASAPGGQLIQATDQWVGVKGARLLLIDDEGVRAPVVAGWLRQSGHEASVLEGGAAAARDLRLPRLSPRPPVGAEPSLLAAGEASLALARGNLSIIDLRSSLAYRQGHIAGAVWSIRPRLAEAVVGAAARTVLLVAEEPGIARLAAIDLAEAGCTDVRYIAEGPEAWAAAGLGLAASPNAPADAARIDFLFFTAKRHEGTAEAAEAARQYLAWEVGLLNQLDAQERGAFPIA
ncbi:MAG TPA: rhodanese-like domain-containing protein [Hyphomicrobiaceae bacterium]|nr:rhodanese-like domain-containing protein [Hyphomicrobiaceae bacterium]